MKRLKYALTLLLLSSNFVASSQISIQLSPEEKLNQLKMAVTDNLTNNILSYWSAKMPDNVNGGFYGRIDAGNMVISVLITGA